MGEHFPLFVIVAFAVAGLAAIFVCEVAVLIIRRDARIRHHLAPRMALPLPLDKATWFLAARYSIVFAVAVCVALGLVFRELHVMGAGILGAIAAIGLRLAAQTEKWHP